MKSIKITEERIQLINGVQSELRNIKSKLPLKLQLKKKKLIKY